MNPSDAAWKFSDTYEWMERLRGGRFAPLMVTCAVNGGAQGKESNAAIPETPEEIALQVRQAYDAGACAVHIHGRARENLADMTDDVDVYREINARVREKCPDIIINNTTGGGPTTTMETRFSCLEARPEMASLNMGPDMSRTRVKPRHPPLPHPHDGLFFDDAVPFTYGLIEQLAERMQALGVKPEMEMYHGGQYWVVRDLIDRQLIEPPYVHQFVMAYQTATYPTPANLCALIAELPDDSIYYVAALGQFQLPLTTLSILMGGHVRVGLEDNIYYSRGRLADGNGELIARTVRIAQELGREVATPAQAREMLGLGAPREYEHDAVRRVAQSS